MKGVDPPQELVVENGQAPGARYTSVYADLLPASHSRWSGSIWSTTASFLGDDRDAWFFPEESSALNTRKTGVHEWERNETISADRYS